MKKFFLFIVLLILLSGCSLQSIKFRNSNSNNSNLIKKDDSASDIFIKKKYKKPLVIALDEFEQSCPKTIQNSRRCNKKIIEKIGCTSVNALNMYYNKLSNSSEYVGFYSCNTIKKESSTLTDNNNVYLLTKTNTITAYYSWDDFVNDLKPIIDSEQEAFSISSFAGFSAGPEIEKQIKKVDSGYLIPNVNYSFGLHDNCFGGNPANPTYKAIVSDIIVQSSGKIKVSQEKHAEIVDCPNTAIDE